MGQAAVEAVARGDRVDGGDLEGGDDGLEARTRDGKALGAQLDDGGGNTAGAEFLGGLEALFRRLRLPAEDEARLRLIGRDDVHRLQHVGRKAGLGGGCRIEDDGAAIGPDDRCGRERGGKRHFELKEKHLRLLQRGARAGDIALVDHEIAAADEGDIVLAALAYIDDGDARGPLLVLATSERSTP